jgi:hypothetical protein
MSRVAKKHHSVAFALIDHAWIAYITGPLTILVIVQYVQLRQWLHHIQVNPDVADVY